MAGSVILSRRPLRQKLEMMAHTLSVSPSQGSSHQLMHLCIIVAHVAEYVFLMHMHKVKGEGNLYT